MYDDDLGIEVEEKRYIPTFWMDRIKDPITGEVIQVGVPVNARNLNKIEQGIADISDESTVALARTEFLVIDALDLRMMYEFDHQARKVGVTANMYWNTYQDSNDLRIESGRYDASSKKVILP